MKKKITVLTLCAVLSALCSHAAAQQATKIPRIGFLMTTSPSVIVARTEAFRQGMRELEYVEGKNIVIEWRSSEGKADGLPGLAAELVRLKLDIIVAAAPPVIRAVKEATSTIPIVMAQDTDPVGNGFVASLARPGGNITGLANLAPEISGKQLEILKETVPKLSRAAVLGTSTQPGNAQSLKETELAAGAFRVKLQYLDILVPKDIESAFRAAGKGQADAVLIMVPSSVASSHRKEIVELAIKSRLPATYPQSQYVEAAGL